MGPQPHKIGSTGVWGWGHPYGVVIPLFRHMGTKPYLQITDLDHTIICEDFNKSFACVLIAKP